MIPPRLVAITPGDAHLRDRVPWVVAMAAAGLRSVLVREPELGAHAHDALVLSLWCAVPDLIVHDRHPRARTYGAPLHLPAHGDPTGWRGPWSRSCHDEAEVDAALAAGASWVVLGPVWRPTSKPQDARAPLGPGGFLAAARGRPALALGGVTPDRARELREAGAVGVAVSGWLFDAPTPQDAADRVRALLAALGGPSPRPADQAPVSSSVAGMPTGARRSS